MPEPDNSEFGNLGIYTSLRPESKTFRTVSAIARFRIGFMTNALIPISFGIIHLRQKYPHDIFNRR